MGKIENDIKAVAALLKKADDNDEVVLYEDGKKTDNTYPKWNVYEPDTKTPEMWVRGIYLHNTLNGRKVDVSFRLVKSSKK